MKFQTRRNKVHFMIQILVEEMSNISLQGWKGNVIYEFKNSKLQIKS